MGTEITTTEDLLLGYLETNDIGVAAAKTGITLAHAHNLVTKLADEIVRRTQGIIGGGMLKAANTIIASMDADASTEKGELKLKAAESILDRTGITKHTSVEVTIENENGIFILPGKAPIAREEAIEADFTEIEPDSIGKEV